MKHIIVYVFPIDILQCILPSIAINNLIERGAQRQQLVYILRCREVSLLKGNLF